MEKIILLKLGEIALKGLNRASFENRLMGNLRRRISPFGKFEIRSAQSTLYVRKLAGPDDAVDRAFEAAGDVFGVVARSMAAECEKNYGAIRETALSFLAERFTEAATFKVDARRSDKRCPMTTPEIMETLGGDILEKYPHLRVDVHHPELTCMVEVRDHAAYVHGDQLPGAGGMPVGSAGEALLLLSGGIDSPVAAYMMAKRGLALTAVHFESPPYTSERAREKVLALAKRLERFTGRLPVWVVPFTEAQLAIRDVCPEEYFTVVMRRLMMRVASLLAEREGLGALITGESLGQVASQTLHAIAVTDKSADRPVFRPLIGMDKEEIVQLSRRIDTYDLSILPYEDCCTVFTPRHPRLKPRLSEVLEWEEKLGAEALAEAAYRDAKIAGEPEEEEKRDADL